ncbi:MAG TPA: carboxypeptidase M32 [Clostridia bacterium]|nr:carboxypeptidase M32 [Clostridia bacterium]
MQETVKSLKALLAKMHAYEHAMVALYYDSETVMPKKGAEGLAQTMGVLSEEGYKLSTGNEMRELLAKLAPEKDALDEITRREVEELGEKLAKLEKIPMEEYVQYSMDVSAATNCWREAKNKNDFASFAPHLEKLVAFNRKLPGYIRPELPKYDALLNEYEKGLTMAMLDDYFANVRSALVPLIREISERGEQPDVSPLKVSFPIPQQRLLTDKLVALLTIDRDRCALGEVEHPFSGGISKNDVRLTTHYHEHDVLSSFYSVVHEGGHSIYELNTGDDLMGSPLGTGASMGIHESQSRLFENMIGRSREFIGLAYPAMAELFPAQMKKVSPELLYRAANRAEPSLIRTEADELTYSLHIMVRYELEKKLIGGTLEVKDLPEAWNALYQEYLGVDVPDDTHGVLQDSHWSGGSFGYFPSYSIGSAYAAQIYDAMGQSLDIPATVKSGDLSPIVAWLTEKIYRFGSLKKPNELILNACGKPFDPSYYTRYLTEKYRALYAL